MRGEKHICTICGREWNRLTERVRDKKTCSKRCASIKGYLAGEHPDTSIETKIQRYLEELGIEYRKQIPLLGITVADVLVEPNVAIFADGDYWHASEMAKYKDNKIKSQLEKRGYIVLRLSETEINSNKSLVLEKIAKSYEKRKITKCL